jgi:hypothetical protein
LVFFSFERSNDKMDGRVTNAHRSFKIPPALLEYEGDCGFCSTSIAQAKHRAGSPGSVMVQDEL